jgi:hypothetical protein
VLDAAFYPASFSLLPGVVAPALIAPANSLVQGSEAIGDVVGGPIAAFGVELVGSGWSLVAVAGVQALAAVTLGALSRRIVDAPATTRTGTWTALREGLRYSWGHPLLRATLGLLLVLNIAAIGPILVGGAVLAEERLGGSTDLGLILSGFGVGSILGLVLAGRLGVPRRRPGIAIALPVVVLGVGLTGFAAIDDLVVGLALAALLGAGYGYLSVVLTSWIQLEVPTELRGRVLSLVVVAAIALDPVSYALAGWLLPLGFVAVFVVPGAVLAASGLAALLAPSVRGAR